MDEITESYDLLYVHQDQVTKAPEGARIFASNSFCPIAAYTIGDHVLSIQGHPEFTAEVVSGIIDFRADILDAEVGDEAMQTLDLPPDNQKMGRAITRFIDNARQSAKPAA
jgi:GMP synthase-like glutamine amidotransferase